MEPTTKLTLSKLLSKYKTFKHVREAYSKAEKIMVDLKYISWEYVKDIVTDVKALINEKDIDNFKLPPRLLNKIKTR